MPNFFRLVASNRINPNTAGSQRPLRIDTTVGGDTLITWDSSSPNAARAGLDAMPLGSAFGLAGSRAQAILFEDNSVATLNVTVQGTSNPFYTLRFQRYDLTGATIGSGVSLDTGLVFFQTYSQVALANGGAAIAYVDANQLKITVLNSSYSIAQNFVVATVRSAEVSGGLTNVTLSIDELANGNLAIGWTNNTGSGVNRHQHFSQIFQPNGTAVGPLFTRSPTADEGIAVEPLPGGGYVYADTKGPTPVIAFFDAAGQQIAGPAIAFGEGRNVSGADLVRVSSNILMVSYDVVISGAQVGRAELFTTNGARLGSAFDFAGAFLVADSIGDGNLTVARPVTESGSSDTDVQLETWQLATDNLVFGTPGPDELSGLGDDRLLIGGAGDDRYFVDGLGDQIIENEGEGYDRVLASAGYGIVDGISIELMTTTNDAATDPIWLVGNSFAQVIFGNEGDNTLVGNGGGDALAGLGGNDELYVIGAGDRVREDAGDGFDRVYTRYSFVLTAGQEVEVLAFESLSATAVLDLTGNEFGQAIYGNEGANVIDGGGGGDDMTGGGGNDTFIVRDTRDVVREDASGSGGDTVRALVDFRLRAGQAVEFITAFDTASTAALLLAGNERAQYITGNAGANVLDDGGTVVASPGGNDALVGLGGDDMYYVSNASTVIGESVGGGFDRVLARVSYVLTSGEVEKITTADNFGTEAINLTGNSFAGQIIYGNAGANELNGGGGGGDELLGLGGDDRYIIGNAGDLVYEDAGGGTDRVLASVSYRLNAGAQIELLSTTNNLATTAIDLTGNLFDQAVYGNAGANVLGGGGGRDDLIGLGGADKFLFDVAPNTAFVSSFALVGPGGNVARINDMGVDDKIWLKGSVFGLTPGALPAGAFNTGPVATEADDRILYDPTSQAILFDPDGAGGAQALLLGFIKDPFVLDASYFQVI